MRLADDRCVAHIRTEGQEKCGNRAHVGTVWCSVHPAGNGSEESSDILSQELQAEKRSGVERGRKIWGRQHGLRELPARPRLPATDCHPQPAERPALRSRAPEKSGFLLHPKIESRSPTGASSSLDFGVGQVA
jgi:hypothetical protein